MPWIRRVELALRGATLLAAAIAAGALLWPPPVPRAEIAPTGLDGGAGVHGHRHAAAADSDVAARIAQANIFSSTRSAPRTRYRPLGADAGAVLDEPAAENSDGVPELFGIVPGPAGAAALLRLDPASAGALLYREGERGGRYRVDRIGDQSVVLTGPSGRVELRLGRPGGADR